MAGEAPTSDVINLPFGVPEEWGTPRLSIHCRFVRDGDWIESKDQGGDAYRLLQISNIGIGRFVETGNYRWITQETFQRLNCTEILPGDVLVARMPEPTGRTWYVPELPWRAVTAVDVAIIRTKNRELDPRFLAYFLNSPACLGIVQSLTTGTTRLRIRRADIERLQIPLPSPEEQRAIAHILGTLDDKIELNRRMNETLEATARALFKSWFVDFDPVRAKAGERDPGLPKHLAGLFPDGFEESELGEIPKGWAVLSLSDCVEAVRGLSYKGSGLSDTGVSMHNLNSIYEGGGYKHQGVKHYEGEYKPQHVARAGDLIVANTEQGHDRLLIGYAAIVPKRFDSESIFSHHIYRVRPKNSSGLTSDFLCHLLNTRVMHDTVSGYANGTTVNMLPIDALQTPRVAVPPSVVVRAFDGLARAARARHEEMIDESRTLAALRDTLLPKLISGELRIGARE